MTYFVIYAYELFVYHILGNNFSKCLPLLETGFYFVSYNKCVCLNKFYGFFLNNTFNSRINLIEGHCIIIWDSSLCLNLRSL